MTYHVSYTSAAVAELEYIIAYYREVAPTIVRHFKPELRQTVRLLSENPYSYQAYTLPIRRAHLGRFPYTLFYTVENETKQVIILAIRHQSMAPAPSNH